MGGLWFGEFEGELEALGFASGEGVSGLPESEVTEAELIHGVEQAVELGDGAEVSFCLCHRHGEGVGDGFAFVGDFEGFAIETFAEAGGALDPCVGQEVHFNFEFAVSLAALAAATFCVKGEAGFGVATLFGEGEFGK